MRRIRSHWGLLIGVMTGFAEMTAGVGVGVGVGDGVGDGDGVGGGEELGASDDGDADGWLVVVNAELL